MQESAGLKPRRTGLQWIGAVLLLVVAYIHLSLVVNTFGLHGRIGILFALNAAGAVVALILIFTPLRVLGWILGLVVAAGAAFAKLTMGSIPGFRTLLMGNAFPGARFAGRGFRGARGSGFPGGGSGGAANFPSGSGAGGGAGGAGSNLGPGSGSGFGGNFGSHAGHFAVRHNVLPVFFNIRSLGTFAIIVEILFVLVAIFAFIRLRPRPSAVEVES